MLSMPQIGTGTLEINGHVLIGGGPGTAWYPTEGLDEKAYRALLRHFGLEDYAEEFPLEKVITMSPAVLAADRREKERLHGLERKEMISDTIGSHYPAEEYK